MKIAIIVAMRKELDLLLPRLENVMTLKLIDGSEAYLGSLSSVDGGHEIFLCECGIGKVNAALKTSEIIDLFEPHLVLNSGVAGGTGKGVAIGDMVVADGVAYHDVWCGPGTDWGQAHGMPLKMQPSEKILKVLHQLYDGNSKIHFGLIASGDIFVSREEDIERISALYPEAVAVDMESAAIAQTCIRRNVPFIILRAVSDTPGEGENIKQYESFWEEAPKGIFAIITDLIKNI